MGHINKFESFNKNHNYVIDWSLYEGEVEYDYLNEKLHIIFSNHTVEDRMKDFKIDLEELEEIIQKAAPEMIRQYELNIDKKRHHFCIRDRSKNYPFEIIMIVDNGIEQPAVKTNIAAIGELYSKEKIDNLEYKKYLRQLSPEDPDYSTLKKLKKLRLQLEEDDYVFSVITTRRKRNFLVDNQKFIILEVFPNETIKVMS